MSAIKVNEQSSFEHHNDQARILAERTQILHTVSRKAQEKTLTLQETNDLFAQFNNTYDLNRRVTDVQRRSAVSQKRASDSHVIPSVAEDGVDESWAIKLLKECEQEDTTSAIKQQMKSKNIWESELTEA